MKLRKAKYSDLKTLLFWANEKDVIKNSIYRSVKINIEDHKIWLKKNLASKKNNIYIASDKLKLVGMIKTDEYKRYYLISYSIQKSHRNKGYGLKIVNMIVNKLFKTDKKKYLKAIVNKKNEHSQKIFKKLNFKEYLLKNKSFLQFIKK